MKNPKIGEATLQYAEDGTIINAKFVGTLEVNFDDTVKEQLTGGSDEKIIKNNADMLLAGFFNELTLIELRDVDKQQIISEFVNCEKYPSGNVQTCTIAYFLKGL